MRQPGGHPPLPRWRAAPAVWAVVTLAGAASFVPMAGGADQKAEKPPLIEVNGATTRLAIPIKYPTGQVTTAELDQALADNPAALESERRMAAVLAGEKGLYAALKLHGQAQIDALEQAARGGEAASAEVLGDMLDTGDGVRADPKRALAYYRAAAIGGRMAAAHSVAVAYAKGRGVRSDFTEALAWMIVARERGDDSGIEDQLRDYLKRNAADAAIALAEQRAIELAAKAKPAEFLAALPAAAPIEYEQELTEAAHEEAGEMTAAEGGAAAPAAPTAEGAPETRPPIVVLTIFGERLSWPDLAALEREAGRGEPAALTALGRLLTNGKLPADPMRALLLLEAAAAKGEIDAAHQLGELYTKGEGIVHDEAKALTYALQAARGGSVVAMASVGVLYTNGRGVPRDLPRGLAWLTLAKEHGVDLGQEKRLRAFLAQYRPEDVAAADKLVQGLWSEITVKPR